MKEGRLEYSGERKYADHISTSTSKDYFLRWLKVNFAGFSSVGNGRIAKRKESMTDEPKTARTTKFSKINRLESESYAACESEFALVVLK
jgi:hypothetical protein